MLNFINSLTCGSFFILAFIIAINPRRVNIAANKWLSFFLLSVGLVMIDAPLSTLGLYTKYPLILIIINFAVFLIAPTLYLSIVYFVTPAKIFHKITGPLKRIICQTTGNKKQCSNKKYQQYFFITKPINFKS